MLGRNQVHIRRRLPVRKGRPYHRLSCLRFRTLKMLWLKLLLRLDLQEYVFPIVHIDLLLLWNVVLESTSHRLLSDVVDVGLTKFMHAYAVFSLQVVRPVSRLIIKKPVYVRIELKLRDDRVGAQLALGLNLFLPILSVIWGVGDVCGLTRHYTVVLVSFLVIF